MVVRLDNVAIGLRSYSVKRSDYLSQICKYLFTVAL